tara:strand:- start:544 stop:2523 length:1980 start_codon:yes stop_codon:yes gene_type:complete
MNKIFKFIDISKIDRISFRGDINGLRAIAVLAVVLYHADIGPFKGGWLGVDIFFVISGYLISNIIISELNNNSFSFSNFYIRRVRRILPALFSTLIFTIPFSYLLLTPKGMMEYTKSVISSIFFYANYYFQNLDFYNAEPTKVMPLLHTWSLSIEEQFYLFFPLLCYLIFKLNKRLFTIFLAGTFLYSVFLNSTTSELLKFYQIQFRAWELILGALVMIFQNKLKIKYIEIFGLTILLFSTIYFDDSMITINSIEPRIVANLGVALVLFNREAGYINNLLSLKILRTIGLSSYSIYLFHQPLFAFLRLSQKKYGIADSNFVLLSVFFTLFLISYLNWKYVEQIFQKIELKKLFKVLLIVLILILFFVFLSEATSGFSNRYDYVPENVLFYSTNPNIYPNQFSKSEFKYSNVNCENRISESNYCVWTNNLTDKNIYLIGDSQTNALSVAFLTEFNSIKNDYNLIFLRGKVGRCLLSQQSDTVGFVDECSDETFENFISKLSKENDIVITFGRFDTWLGDKGKNEIKCDTCDYSKVFSNRMKRLALNVKQAYFIEPIPTYSFAIAESYLYKRNNWGEPITLELDEWNHKILKTRKFLNSIDNESKNINIISPIPVFCDEEIELKCFASTTEELYYSDSNHLTHEGAKLLALTIEKEIKKIK